MSASAKEQSSSLQLPDDIWFHLANHIPPEDVKRYALICTKSANSINSRAFWFRLYDQYCQQTSDPTEELPEHLQLKHLRHCDLDVLKQRVIQILYLRYPPFKLRLETPYSLDLLAGRTYVRTLTRGTFNCYSKFLIFKLTFPLNDLSATIQNYSERTLNCIHGNAECQREQDYEGLMGLFVRSTHCLNFPYKCLKSEILPYRLISIRKDSMFDCGNRIKITLEFVSYHGTHHVCGTLSNIEEWEVIPWWHPKFRFNG